MLPDEELLSTTLALVLSDDLTLSPDVFPLVFPLEKIEGLAPVDSDVDLLDVEEVTLGSVPLVLGPKF